MKFIKTKYLLFLGLMCICLTVNAQLIIPKKKCTRGKCYYVDQTGKRISNYYEDVTDFQEGLGGVQLGGKWGFVNDSMEVVIPLTFEKATTFKEGLASIKLDKEYYLINREGETKSEKYDSIEYFGDYLLIKKDNKFGLLELNGKTKEPLRFDRISAFYNDDFGVQLDGKWANYNNGNLNYDNPTIYFSDPEELPVFEKKCINTEDLDQRKTCSEKELLTKIYSSIRYPKVARQNGIDGLVMIRFVVNKEGIMENPEIAINVGGGCGDEALNVVKTYLKKWALPGMENEAPVNTLFHLPVNFKLE